MCIYIYFIVFIGNIIEHNWFFQSCLHFALLLSNPNHKKTTHKTYISTNHGAPLACFFFWSFCLFWFGFQSRRAKCRPHWTTLCVVPMCLKFLPNISSINYLANKNQLYHGGGPMSTQPHLWISSKCSCSVDFLWFSLFGYPDRQVLKTMGKKFITATTWIYLPHWVPQLYLFSLLGSRAPGASILYPKKGARTQPKNAKETQWVR